MFHTKLFVEVLVGKFQCASFMLMICWKGVSFFLQNHENIFCVVFNNQQQFMYMETLIVVAYTREEYIVKKKDTNDIRVIRAKRLHTTRSTFCINN